MRVIGGSTLRGGQTVFHGLHMWGQLFRAALLLAAFLVVAVPAWRVWQNTSGYDWYAALMVTVAEAKLGIGYAPDSQQTIRQRNGYEVVLPLPQIAHSPTALAIRENLKNEIFAGAIFGAKNRSRGDAVAARAVLVPGPATRPKPPHPGRGAGHRPGTQTPHPPPPSPHARPVSGNRPACRTRSRASPFPNAPKNRHTIVSGTTGFWQDRADLRSRFPDPRPRRALRDLRQDGRIHPRLFRSTSGRAAQPPGRAKSPLVAFSGSQKSTGFRHHGRRAHPAAKRHRRSLLGHRGQAAFRQRRRGIAEKRALPKTGFWSSIS